MSTDVHSNTVFELVVVVHKNKPRKY